MKTKYIDTKLKNICKIQGGYAFKSVEFRNEGIQLIRISNISENGIDFNKNPIFLNNNYLTTHKNYSLKKGDILISLSGATTGKFGIYSSNRTSLLNQRVGKVKIESKDINNKYLFYFMYVLKNLIFKKASGVAQPNISPNEIENFKIPLPPLPVQEKIAAVLDRASGLIVKRKAAIEKLDSLIQSVFLDMFGDPVTNPKGWRSDKLENISKIVSGITKGKKINGKVTQTMPYMRVANVQDGFLDLTEIKTIEVTLTDAQKYLLRHGDILLTEGGDPDKLGRGCVWRNEIENCIHQNHIFRVRVDKKVILPQYISMHIGSNYGKNYFLKASKQTTGIASINSKQLKNFKVIIPPLKLQNRFVSIITKYNLEKEKMQSHLMLLEDNFNSLLDRAFRGELEFNDVAFDRLKSETAQLEG